MKNKNILITGGLGFIGSNLSNRLIEDNEVIIVDNLSTGNIYNIKEPDHENLTITHQDIRNINFDEITEGIDYIFHLAAMASVPLSVIRPFECNEINVDGTIRLLKSAVKNNVEKVIFSSSSAVYGQNENLPLKETDPLMPTSPYGVSKASCDFYLKSFYDTYGLDYVSLRYFNVFGPKQNKRSEYAAVIPSFINSLLENRQPVIYGDGEQTRDFVFIDDVVDANINACDSNFNGIVNVASGENISINELYDIIKTTIGSDLEPEYQRERLGDIKHSLADVSNMEKINLKTDPKKFYEQLDFTIQWYKIEI
ncbi:NAD-dependent epimerase/dehydratase family protein [Methanobrevibacter sp.]|uniref:NAD-dependent epimerase/dehydratase family protein n=1 Tax=Methanobrevibacter sp. TaxID=66852 RepID=UPI0038682C70